MDLCKIGRSSIMILYSEFLGVGRGHTLLFNTGFSCQNGKWFFFHQLQKWNALCFDWKKSLKAYSFMLCRKHRTKSSSAKMVFKVGYPEKLKGLYITNCKCTSYLTKLCISLLWFWKDFYFCVFNSYQYQKWYNNLLDFFLLYFCFIVRLLEMYGKDMQYRFFCRP